MMRYICLYMFSSNAVLGLKVDRCLLQTTSAWFTLATTSIDSPLFNKKPVNLNRKLCPNKKTKLNKEQKKRNWKNERCGRNWRTGRLRPSGAEGTSTSHTRTVPLVIHPITNIEIWNMRIRYRIGISADWNREKQKTVYFKKMMNSPAREGTPRRIKSRRSRIKSNRIFLFNWLTHLPILPLLDV